MSQFNPGDAVKVAASATNDPEIAHLANLEGQVTALGESADGPICYIFFPEVGLESVPQAQLTAG